MKHIASISRGSMAAYAGNTPEEVAKFISGALELIGSAVGVLAGIEELRDLKEGIVNS